MQNKIVGTPILKLAIVKRFKVHINTIGKNMSKNSSSRNLEEPQGTSTLDKSLIVFRGSFCLGSVW